MTKPIDGADSLISRTADDHDLRARLLARPKETIEAELGVELAEDHEINVHEDTYDATHIVLPPRSKYTRAEREEAKTGAASFKFLRKTLYHPAPPLRSPEHRVWSVPKNAATTEAHANACRESVRRGLDFLDSKLDENGAWYCIRFNVADPNIPRHFEKPAFVSAYCVLALERCGEAQAKSICAKTRSYLHSTIEHPGLWRYYRHLPQDLDSTALSSQVIGTHPWVFLGKNIPRILANRDEDGLFMTWLLDGDEPDVVSRFRIEADPVVNANVVAYLGDRPETRDARHWLEALITEGDLEGSSKWYPDEIAIYYAVTRAMKHVRPALDPLGPILAERVLGLRDNDGGFGNILHTAQAVSVLDEVGYLERMDLKHLVERFIGSQREDGSWPELLAFGDQTLKWGTVGQFGHGSDTVTSAFCIEALARLVTCLSIEDPGIW